MTPSTQTALALLTAVLVASACAGADSAESPQERADARASEGSPATSADAAAAQRDTEAAPPRDAEAAEHGDASQPQQMDAAPHQDASSAVDAGLAVDANSPAVDAMTPVPTADAGNTGARWVGYIENHTFRSGSDALTLTLDVLEPGRVAGQIMFGKGPAGPPPNPNSTLGDNSFHNVQEAYAYPMVDASFDGERLRFGVAAMKIWQDFCASFAPIADEVNKGRFSCIPNWSYSSTGREEPGGCYLTNPMTRRNERFDCARYTFCNGVSGVCACDASKCGADDAIVMRFDVVVLGGRMDGSLTGLGGSNVHLKPQ